MFLLDHGSDWCTLYVGQLGARSSTMEMLRVQGVTKKNLSVCRACAVELFSSLRTFGRTTEGGERGKERTAPFSLVTIYNTFTYNLSNRTSPLIPDNKQASVSCTRENTRLATKLKSVTQKASRRSVLLAFAHRYDV